MVTANIYMGIQNLMKNESVVSATQMAKLCLFSYVIDIIIIYLIIDIIFKGLEDHLFNLPVY